MVDAIKSALSTGEQRRAFVVAALRSHERVVACGQAIHGVAFSDYLKARAHGPKVVRPKASRIASVLSQSG